MQRSSSIYLYVTPAFSLLFQSLRISLSYFVHLHLSRGACNCVISSPFSVFILSLSLPPSSFFLLDKPIHFSPFCFFVAIFVSFDRIESFDLREKRERMTYFDDNNDNAIMVCRYFCFRWVSKSIAMTCQDGANAFYDSLKIRTDRVNRDKINLSSRRSPTVSSFVPVCFSFLYDSWNEAQQSSSGSTFFSFHPFLFARFLGFHFPSILLPFFPDPLGRI